MEYVGHVGPDGYDEVVVAATPTDRDVHRLLARGGRVVAGMHVNDWDAIDPIRDLVGRQRAPPTRLRDEKSEPGHHRRLSPAEGVTKSASPDSRGSCAPAPDEK